VAAELDLEAGFGRAPAHHPVGIDTVHWLLRQHTGLAGGRAEEESLAIVPAGRGEIFVEELSELVMRRHLVALGAFIVKAHPPALAAVPNPRKC
jgi:hypothetical protein